MYGTASEELEVKVPASEAWKLYRSLQLPELVSKAFPNLINKFNILQGDGCPGTIIEVFYFHPGQESKLTWCKEKITVVDDEKRVKGVEVIEGGILDHGFTMSRTRFEVIEKEGKEREECITRATVEYEVKEEAAANVALISSKPLLTIMQVAADYLQKNYNNHDVNL